MIDGDYVPVSEHPSYLDPSYGHSFKASLLIAIYSQFVDHLVESTYQGGMG